MKVFIRDEEVQILFHVYHGILGSPDDVQRFECNSLWLNRDAAGSAVLAWNQIYAPVAENIHALDYRLRGSRGLKAQVHSQSAVFFLQCGSDDVQKAKNYIRLHINEPITQKEVASYLGISPGYLCSLFQKAEHTPLIQYVNRQKLTEIKILMEQKHLKLNEAASLYGYSDPNYVSRLYKNIFQHNITDRPTKYSGDWQCGSPPAPRPSAHT